MAQVPVQTIMLGPTPPDPEVEIILGNAQVGVYDFFLWDSTAANPQLVKKGTNADAMVDRFVLPSPPGGFKNRYISCQVLISTPTEGPGQMYSITVLVRQSGVVVGGGVLQEAGSFQSNTKSTVLFGRFA